jgi:beta-lactamase superfamily II metal-dependent hydrolase
MDDKLLVRVYDVGFGDCIFVRIPDGDGHFCALIDCGTSASANPKKNSALKNALDDALSMLPVDDEGKRRLDLLVATHPHADHIKGFDAKWFKDVKIARIWLSAFMKLDHPQAKGMRAFQDMANDAAGALLARQGLHLGPGVRALLSRSIWNPGALKALREGLAQSSGIESHYPLYVGRDVANWPDVVDPGEYELKFEQGTTRFTGFEEPTTRMHVLAPEWDIDKYYLGQGLGEGHALFDRYLLRTKAYGASAETLGLPAAEAEESTPETGGEADATELEPPDNISVSDFQQLRNRLLYSALAFSQKDDDLKNNTSAVLLLEWRGRRLLFTGDAEWTGRGVEEDRRNSTWDVMLRTPGVKQLLLQPLDLLKVGHHGSHNGTPFHEGGKEEVLQEIASPHRTQVVVSTVSGEHGKKNPVPYPELLRELGRLAANKRRYPNCHEEELKDVDQPQRTDLEASVAGSAARYVQVTFAGVDD